MKKTLITLPDPLPAPAGLPRAPAQAGTLDRIELMQTFVRIVESGSLSAAALQLGSTQPTISRRLQSLERLLGLRLMQRSTHHMRLTEDGARCYEGAKQLLDNWGEFESGLRGTEADPDGVLRIVAPHAFGQDKLIGPLAEYLRRYPRVQVEWLLHDDRAIQDFIATGIDCAIQVGEVQDSALVALRLGEVPRILVAAPDLLASRESPKAPADLESLPWLALRTYYRHEVVLHQTQERRMERLKIEPRMSTDSLYALRSAALQGLGVAICSAWVVADDLASGKLVQLLPSWQAAPLPVHLIYPYARFYPARLRCFLEIMRQMAPAALG